MTQLKCAAGSKPCGKRCIPKTYKCRLQGEGDEQGIKGAVKNVKTAVGKTAANVKDAAGNAVEGVKDAAGNVAKTAKGAVQGIKDAAGNAVEGVKDAAENAVEGVKGMSTKKKIALAAGAGLALVAGGALVYGVNTGKIKLPSGEELNPFNSQQGQMFLDKVNPYSPMNQSDRQRRAAEGDNVAYNQQKVLDGLQKLSQPVSEQAEKAFNKVNSGFSAIQKAILDSDGKFSMDLTAQSIGNMANGIIDSSKNAATALSATVQAQSTLMMAAMKDNLKAAGVNVKAVMESIKSGAQGVGDNISRAMEGDFTPSQKLENLKNLASDYMKGGREFAGQKLQETLNAAKDIGGKVQGLAGQGFQKTMDTAKSIGQSAVNAYNTSGASQVVEGTTGLAKDATEGAIEFFQDFNANLFQNGANVISKFGNAWQDGAKAFFGAVGSIFSAPTNGVSKELGGLFGSWVGIEGKAKADDLAEKIRAKAPAKQERARQINLFGGSQKVENNKPAQAKEPKPKKQPDNPDQLSLDLWN